MQLRIKHTTSYEFDAPVSFGLQQLRKTPKSFRNQRVLSWATTVSGGQKELSFEDFHRNTVELISFDPNITGIELVSEGVVEVEDNHGVTGCMRAQPHYGCSYAKRIAPKLERVFSKLSAACRRVSL